MNPYTRRAWIAVVFLLAVAFAYYTTHPIDLSAPTFAAPLTANAVPTFPLDLLPLALVALAGGALGHTVLAWTLGPLCSRLSHAERAALGGVVGLGLLSIGALVLGLVGLYQRVALWAWAAACAALCWRGMTAWLADLWAALRHSLPLQMQANDGTARAWLWLMIAFVALMLLTALGLALLPPTAFDAVNYHLVGPARYLRDGRIAAYADNHFLGFPQGAEVLYGMAIGLFNRDTAAAPLHLWFGVLSLLGIGGIVHRYTGRHAGRAAAWLACALPLTAWSVWLLFGWAYVDLAMMAYGMAVLVVASLADGDADAVSDRLRLRVWVLLGALIGLALGVKYTALGLAVMVGVWALGRLPRGGWAHTLRAVLWVGVLMGGAAAVLYLPWALKGWLLYQNPVYPFVFGGLNWDSLRTNTFSGGQGLWGTGGAWQLLILPLAATINGVEKGVGFSASMGPWLLTVPLLLLIAWRGLDTQARDLARLALGLAWPALAYWIVLAAASPIGGQTRLMLFALPVAAVLSALTLYGLLRSFAPPRAWLRPLVWSVLAASLGISAWGALRQAAQQGVGPYLVGQASRAAILQEGLGVYASMMAHLATLPDGARVLFLFESKSYHCPPAITCTPDVLFDNWARPLRLGVAQTAAQLRDQWRAQGVDYVLVFNVGYDFWRDDARFAAENARLPELLALLGAPVWADAVQAYALYVVGG
jgi:hypothetical protein